MRPFTLALAVLGLAAAAASADPARPGCAGLDPAACLPLERGDGGSPVIAASVDAGAPVHLVLDTAASGTTLDEATMVRIGAVRDAAMEKAEGLGGAFDVKLYKVERLRAGPLTLAGFTAPAIPPPAFDSHAIVGLGGIDLFGDRLAVWEMARGRVRLAASGSTPDGPDWTRTEANWMRAWKVMVPVEIEGVKGWGLVDTGAQYSTLNPAYAAALGLTEASGRLRPGGAMSGIDGAPLPLHAADVTLLSVGAWRWTSRPVRIGDLPVFERLGDPSTPLMIVGADWLEGEAFAIDYGTRALWQRLRPEAPSAKQPLVIGE